ncbi:MAG: prepilin peptidase [Hyphomonadaceae bacterium]|nr:prepilin peptidase [Hyphomonadaceae bacterium]
MSLAFDAQLLAAMSAPLGALVAVRRAYAFTLAGDGAPDSPDARLILVLGTCIAFGALAAETPVEALARVALLCGLAHLAMIDWRLMVIPVRLCLMLIAGGLAFGYFQQGGVHALVCAAAAGAGWTTCRTLERLHVAVRGRSGLGEGDALIAAVLGAWLSVDGLALSVAIGGVLTILAMRLLRRSAGPFPFAPGLALGALIVLLVKQWT